MLVGSVRERLDKEHAETGRAPTSTDGLLRQSSVSAKTIEKETRKARWENYVETNEWHIFYTSTKSRLKYPYSFFHYAPEGVLTRLFILLLIAKASKISFCLVNKRAPMK